MLSTPNTVTNLHVAAPSGPEAAECLVCSELALLVLFSPCQHRTVCEGECRDVGGPGGPGSNPSNRALLSLRPASAECARRMKKCIRCQVVIGKKLRSGGLDGRGGLGTAPPLPRPDFPPPPLLDGTEVASAAPPPGPPRQLVEELQSRYRQMEERITCPICIDSHIRLVFQCGHGACAPCGAALSACPICRQPVRDRIQIFV